MILDQKDWTRITVRILILIHVALATGPEE